MLSVLSWPRCRWSGSDSGQRKWSREGRLAGRSSMLHLRSLWGSPTPPRRLCALLFSRVGVSDHGQARSC